MNWVGEYIKKWKEKRENKEEKGKKTLNCPKMQKKQSVTDGRTDGRTNGRTDQQMDTTSYRDATANLKSEGDKSDSAGYILNFSMQTAFATLAQINTALAQYTAPAQYKHM